MLVLYPIFAAFMLILIYVRVREEREKISDELDELRAEVASLKEALVQNKCIEEAVPVSSDADES